MNGTKRWATHVGVCPRVAAGRLGRDNDYVTAPAEGFAESYRALHFPEHLSSWSLDRQLKPDETALELIRKDVMKPYAGPRKVRGGAGRFGAARRQFERLRTPLDGELTASIRTTGTLRAKLRVVRAGEVVARGSGRRQRLHYDVCGSRTVKFAVKRVRGAGTYRISALRP